ncbi:hypothetical protein ACWC4D_23835 [Streptomyces sp. NPDC001288]|uniref:hypothetical protein n=1 Tax=unclassified Streptomyces TaxID=2593676 RepID=UPI003321369A
MTPAWSTRAPRRPGRTGLGRGLLVLPAALLLAGCGIQRTEVVGTGAPATLDVTATGSGGGTVLLFLRSPDGRLTPVPRVGGAPGQLPVDMPVRSAVLRLLAGPLPPESAAGLGTSLPRVTNMNNVKVRVTSRQAARLSLPLAVGELDRTALGQLRCTASFAVNGTAQVTVRITGRDGVTRTGTCDLGTRGATGAPRVEPRTKPPA